ncbi:hypothetical protein Pint_10800 [Pistacia integerrima]|uniref:Uncharacterized protein n=1 Tax=Pistacia integerrima TaxID=434235 RepID=A0ACC0XJ63_9ROSI|nr:hypothetical protein Pint_10800 [Pistacia integerrima]
MEVGSCRISVVFVFLTICFCSDFGTAIDTITSSQSIRDLETIISRANKFKLGFFSPGNSSNRYVGIWYNKLSTSAVIWVANRNKPLNDSSGIITITEDGNLVVLNGQREVIWSSNVSNSVNNASAQLLDSGNLVLRDNTKGVSIWESFEEPTDSFLSGMRISTNIRTGEKVKLTSWKSPSDPSIGSFSAGLDALNIPEIFIWNNSRPFWRSGPWNGRVFLGVPNMNSVYLDGFNLVVDDQEGTAYLTFSFVNMSLFFVLKSKGVVEERKWIEEKEEWMVPFWNPNTECDVYGMCGAFGSCDPLKKPICSCLRGFEPKNVEEWNGGNWSDGCVRRRELQCERIKKTVEAGKEDGFLKLKMMKVPGFSDWSSAPESEGQCREQCLNNCSCIAYAYDVGIGCMLWSGNLIDIQKLPSAGTDLYIRLAHSEFSTFNAI